MDYLINLALELKASYEPFMFKILIAAFLGGAIGKGRPDSMHENAYMKWKEPGKGYNL